MRSVVLFISIMLGIGFPHWLIAQINWSGRQYTEYAVDQKHDRRFFENWTDVVMQYEPWKIGLRYEIHTPPQLFSQQKAGQGIYQRFIEYRLGGLTMTAGNFYTMLGRGLTLRSFENRMLRWDNNIDGLKVDYRHRYTDIRLFGGRMRDLPGDRHESMQGADVRLKPWSQWQPGATLLVTQLPGRGDLTAVSGYMQFNFKNWKSYAEVALMDHPDDRSAFQYHHRHAVYASANWFIHSLSLSAEIKHYERFYLQEGAILNNPPAVVREHLFTLMNRHQLVQNADDERGYLLEASYPITDESILTVHTSHSWNRREQNLYREYYLQCEWDYPQDWKWIGGAGRQQDLEARYLNAVAGVSWSVTPTQALKFTGEHQHSRIHLTQRQYYSQVAVFSWSRARKWTFSLITERTTEQYLNRRYWIGFQADWSITDKFDLSVFIGNRREGKYCAGGVCVQKPEFRGIELIWMARL